MRDVHAGLAAGVAALAAQGGPRSDYRRRHVQVLGRLVCPAHGALLLWLATGIGVDHAHRS